MIANNAENYFIGATPIEKIYHGSNLIWEKGNGVTQEGWYSVTMNSDTKGDWDESTLTYNGWYLPNYELNSLDFNIDTGLFETTKTVGTNHEAKTTAGSGELSTRYGTSTANYAVNIMDPVTRKWSRLDTSTDYWIWDCKSSASYSRSVTPMVSDPRFLINNKNEETYNFEGVYIQWPEEAWIYLKVGETLDTLPDIQLDHVTYDSSNIAQEFI